MLREKPLDWGPEQAQHLANHRDLPVLMTLLRIFLQSLDPTFLEVREPPLHRNLVIRLKSLFFLHSADHPSLKIISHRLDETNYGDWNVAMLISLDAKNKSEFIDLISDKNFCLWSRCNSLVKSWLLNYVSPQVYRSILRMNDALDIWRDLHSHFNMTILPHTYNLTQEI